MVSNGERVKIVVPNTGQVIGFAEVLGCVLNGEHYAIQYDNGKYSQVHESWAQEVSEKTWSVLFDGCPWTTGRGDTREDAIEYAKATLTDILPYNGRDVPTEWSVVDIYPDRDYLFWVH